MQLYNISDCKCVAANVTKEQLLRIQICEKRATYMLKAGVVSQGERGADGLFSSWEDIYV